MSPYLQVNECFYINEVSISLGCFNYRAQYCEESITVLMISLVILFDQSLFMQSVSASYFKTIKQLICCDNHSDLCHSDNFDFECFRVRVFYKICCHGYQIIESFRLPFVLFSARFCYHFECYHVYFIAIEMPVAFISVLVVSGRTPVLSHLGKTG